MKKALLGAVALSVALVGCATNHPNAAKQDGKPIPHHPANAHDSKDMKGHQEGKKGERPHFYVCEKNIKIAAKYDDQRDLAKLRIDAPVLGLHNQEVELKLAVSGSGVRYVNDKNPASIYDWHTKNDSLNMLTITANGAEYSYSCEAKR